MRHVVLHGMYSHQTVTSQRMMMHSLPAMQAWMDGPKDICTRAASMVSRALQCVVAFTAYPPGASWGTVAPGALHLSGLQMHHLYAVLSF